MCNLRQLNIPSERFWTSVNLTEMVNSNEIDGHTSSVQ